MMEKAMNEPTMEELGIDDSTDKAWKRFLQDLELAKNYPLSGVLPLGEVRNPILDALLPSYLFLRLVSLLDEALNHYIEGKSIPVPKKDWKPDLFHRVELLSQKGCLRNAKTLHDLRDARKNLAHESNPKYIDWVYLETALDTVEGELKNLGVVRDRPQYDFFAECSDAGVPQDDPKVAFVQNHRVGLKEHGKLVVWIDWRINVLKE